MLDAGAARAISAQGRSLLPAGIVAVHGRFERGDIVALRDPEGAQIGVGLSNYSAADIERIRGQSSTMIEATLGYDYGSEVVPPATTSRSPDPPCLLHPRRPRPLASAFPTVRYASRMPELNDYPASHTYFSQRLRLHYVDWGNPDAPPLILVHGGSDHCRSWDWVALALRDRYHVIAPDLRGHGDSQWVIGSGYAMIDYVYDLAHLVRQQDLAPVTLLGHSLGGRISLEYAGIYPERVARLIAIEGLSPSRRETDAHSERPADQRHVIVDREHARLRRPPATPLRLARGRDRAHARGQPRLSDEQALHLTTHAVNQNEDGTFAWKFDNYARSSSPYPFNEADAEEMWNRVRMPALLVNGLESAGDPHGDERTNSFPQAQLVGVANAGHWVHHDQLETFLAAVESFLAN